MWKRTSLVVRNNVDGRVIPDIPRFISFILELHVRDDTAHFLVGYILKRISKN